MTHILDKENLSVEDVLLVPRRGVVPSRSSVIVDPYIYSAPMDTVTGYELTAAMVKHNQFAVVCRNIPTEEWLKCAEEFHNEPGVFFAIGLCKEEFTTLENLCVENNWTINVAVDVAHGHMNTAIDFYRLLHNKPWVNKIMSGSIATGRAALDCALSGCTHLRVGIGPGHACQTRVETGIGVPQLTAIYWVHKGLLAYGYTSKGQLRRQVQVIADGGIRNPGQANKYLAAGADGIMLGSMLAKTKESAGWINEGYAPIETGAGPVSFPRPEPKPCLIKYYRGHASAEFQLQHHGRAHKCPEGVQMKGYRWEGDTVGSVIGRFVGGAESAASYLGLTATDSINPAVVEMIKITSSAAAEGAPKTSL